MNPNIAQTTLVRYTAMFREVLFERMIVNGSPVGGENRTIEIDETLIGKRKYHRGKMGKQQWVFGGIERETGQVFMVPVEKRDAATLVPIIQKWILPDSTIISDCWGAYNKLASLGYKHVTVNHSKNFVDPETGMYCTLAS